MRESILGSIGKDHRAVVLMQYRQRLLNLNTNRQIEGYMKANLIFFVNMLEKFEKV